MMAAINDLAQRRTALSESKQALIEMRLKRKGQTDQRSTSLPKRPADAVVPASFVQQRLWFLDQLEPDSATLNIPIALRIHGNLRVSIMEQSLSEIVRRHETLRTTFPEIDGKPIQRIHDPWPVSLPVIDLRTYSEQEREQEAYHRATQEAQLAFDLASEPLLRGRVFQLAENEYLLVIILHHIITDGWSMGIFAQELIEHYQAYLTGKPLSLPPLPVQYADYVYWQQQALQGKELEQQLDYWRKQLADLPEPLELPTDRPRPAVQTFRGATYHFTLPRELAERLRAVSQQMGTTLFMTVLAAFQALLARYTGQEDMLIGTSIANRTRPELEQIIGFFANTLVLRTSLTGNPTFRELCMRVKDVALEAYAHQEVPFEQAVGRIPPMRVMFVLQNAPQAAVSIEGLTFEPIVLETGGSKFDLLFNLEDREDMACSFEYNADLFDVTTIERTQQHLQQFLTEALAHPDRRLSDIQFLSPTELQYLLVEWNETHDSLPLTTLHHQFELQAERTPQALAIDDGERTCTYKSLHQQANQLAYYLRSLGVGADILVGLYLDRSLEQMLAVLGILKAGGAYVPLDSAFSGERFHWILQDAQVGIVITTSAFRQQLSEYNGVIVYLDELQSQLTGQPITTPRVETLPEHLAYVIYTSGSTGRPKGVQVTHRSVVNHALSIAKHYHLQSSDRVLQFASLSFDTAAEEIYPTWFSGATLVLRPPELPTSTAQWHQWLEQMHISVMEMPTAYWHQWTMNLAQETQAFPSHIRLVLVGGEQVLPDCYRQWLHHVGMQVQWSNTYGPTETTVTSLIYDAVSEDNTDTNAKAPIGRPISNTQAYVFDAYLRPVPVGVVGELYLGGTGLARGYQQRPDLTAERFLPHPYAAQPGERLYRTGDLVRYLPDGNLEFLGRSDTQVKVRGYRIELAEITSVLYQHPAIQECVVVVREDQPGDKRLIAYIVTRDTGNSQPLDLHTIRAFLKERLPEYMLPNAFVTLSSLPTTTSGKINVRALPAPDTQGPLSPQEIVSPRNPVEEVLVDVWASVLNLPEVSIDDNFFDIGGHSLLATQLVARVQQIFTLDIPLRRLFEAPTVARFASVLLQDNDEAERILTTAQLLLSVAELSEEEVELMLLNNDVVA